LEKEYKWECQKAQKSWVVEVFVVGHSRLGSTVITSVHAPNKNLTNSIPTRVYSCSSPFFLGLRLPDLLLADPDRPTLVFPAFYRLLLLLLLLYPTIVVTMLKAAASTLAKRSTKWSSNG
jgi:hypothetical protein